MTDRIIKYIDKHGMINVDETVLCAVSGGADSMCMLNVLRRAGYDVVCAHFNHRLRGEESDRDEAFVREFCEKSGIPFYLGSGDVAARAEIKRVGIEESARELRYGFLEETARELGIGRIATAHTASDNAETVLLNLARGSGMRGISGIPPVRLLTDGGDIRVIRPLLCVTRSEVEAYLRANGISNIEDSSNYSDDFARNRLRHHVTPLLREMNPRFETAALNLGESLREDEEFIRRLALEFIGENAEETEDGMALPTDKAADLPRPVLMRVIREIVPRGLSVTHMEAIERLVKSSDARGFADVPGGRFAKEYGFLRFCGMSSETPPEIEKTELNVGGTVYIPAADKYLVCDFIENCADINSSFNIFCFKNDTVRGTMFVRSRMPGDELRLPGRKTKSLKKLFSEARLSLESRALTPVIADDDGVIAVYGFGVSERCLPKPGDDIVKIDIRGSSDVEF